MAHTLPHSEPESFMIARTSKKKGNVMLGWSIMFLVIALVAALLGFAGIAGAAATIAKVLFFIFLVLFLVTLIAGRRRV